MMKIKSILLIALFSLSLLLTSCGSIYKKNFVQHTSEPDYYVVFLDSLGILVFVFPGIIALSIDYATGTLFLTEEQLKTRAYPLSPSKVRTLILYNDKPTFPFAGEGVGYEVARGSGINS
ncbi:MAG: hypothetical protein LBQ34_06335 [Alphaproteobacteria bacterium]|jgi:hypothetical protein|nr:hypothetical protein [Alphaproteobacteria bacterium]